MSLKVSRILHAGYIFEYQGVQVAFDPILENPFSRNCYTFPAVEFDDTQIKSLKLDAVIISHFHDDHCSLESLNYLDRSTPIFLYCLFEDLFTWIKELGFVNVNRLELNQELKLGQMIVTPRRALDEEVDSMFHIQAGDIHVLNVVDSWIDYETLDLLCKTKWDLILWPFQTMREMEVLSPSRFPEACTEIPPEWKEQITKLNPKAVVPSSCQFIHEPWSWYNSFFFPISYEGFRRQIQKLLPACDVIRLDPGKSIERSLHSWKEASCLPWVIPQGAQAVDYEYRADLKIPAMAEVAKYFPPLTDVETKAVLDFCKNEVPRKYASLDHSGDDYFLEDREWMLKIYDHRGHVLELYYHIRDGQMQILRDPSSGVSWLTEVSIYKIHSALTTGESLTSMYLRVNDIQFDSETEKDLKNIDFTEDPLIRCLFDQSLGAYQLAQLKKILCGST